jgi:hypothetical protein
VDGLNRRKIHLPRRISASETRVFAVSSTYGTFQILSNAIAQFGRGGLREGNRRQPLHLQLARGDQLDNAARQGRCLTRAGTRLDEKRRVQLGLEAISYMLI